MRLKITPHIVSSSLMALLFAILVQVLPLELSEDFEGYVTYFYDSGIILSDRTSDGLSFLANEPLFLILNLFLSTITDSPELAIRAIIFTSTLTLAFIFFYVNAKHKLLMLLFLLTPQMFHNFTTHIRQGLGMAVFYAGFYFLGRHRGLPLMLAAPFIHASLFFVLPAIFARDILESFRVRTKSAILLLSAAALSMGMTTGFLASFLGARQADNYNFASFAGSGLGLLFWIGVGALVYLQGKRIFWAHTAAVAILLQYYFGYLFVETAGRIFEAGLPLVFMMILHLTGWRKNAFLAAYGVYFLISWYLKFQTDFFFKGLL